MSRCVPMSPAFERRPGKSPDEVLWERQTRALRGRPVGAMPTLLGRASIASGYTPVAIAGASSGTPPAPKGEEKMEEL